MTFIINDACIRCKYMDCVTVCPVDCFHEGETMLVINPDHCIDCGACWGACPVGAIQADSEPDVDRWIELNRFYAPLWPAVFFKREPQPGTDDLHKHELGKFEKYFSDKPAENS